MGGGLPLLGPSSPLGVPGVSLPLHPLQHNLLAEATNQHLGGGSWATGTLLPFYENRFDLTQMGLLLITSRNQHPELYCRCEHTGLYLAANYGSV